MKKIFFLFLFFWGVLGFSQTQTSQIKSNNPSDSTGFGRPDGKLVSKQIGTTGGTIISDDGRVELVFPQGALTTNTTISIQPTANLAPNGVGKSYWFEPSGIQFKKPVQIIFRYTDEEAEVCPPDWMSLGIQDHKGKWIFVDYESFDSTSKTLKGFIHHFSHASNINDIQLMPDTYVLLVTDSTYIEAIDVSRPPDSFGLSPAILSGSNPVLCYANGVLHGNNLTGTITAFQVPLGKEKIIGVSYKAPKIIPRQNPVAIWVEIYRKTRKGKELRRRLKTTIEVIDAYKISLIHDFIGRSGLESRLIDSASCIVWIEKNQITLSNIKNYPPIVIREGRNGPFREKIFTDGALGTIHLTDGISKAKLSKDHPPEVYFEVASREVLGYKFQHIARGAKSEIDVMKYKTIPEEINFLANGEVQRYTITTGLSDEKENYILIVRPHRER